MTLELPIEEYFKYHPPTTPERIALHDRVNRESLEICKALINADAIFSDKEVDRICDRAIKLASETCWDEECVTWAIKSIDKARQVAIIIPPEETREADILMHVQQFRMFLNQGITVDELRQQQLAKDMAAVPQEPESAPKAYGITSLLADAKLGIDEFKEINDRIIKSVQPIFLYRDGNQWCALVGENIQVGIAALSDLHAKLRGLEFLELKNEHGIYSTSIKSVSPCAEQIERYDVFIEAYEEALTMREEDGLTERERLVVAWIEHQIGDD